MATTKYEYPHTISMNVIRSALVDRPEWAEDREGDRWMEKRIAERDGYLLIRPKLIERRNWLLFLTLKRGFGLSFKSDHEHPLNLAKPIAEAESLPELLEKADQWEGQFQY